MEVYCWEWFLQNGTEECGDTWAKPSCHRLKQEGTGPWAGKGSALHLWARRSRQSLPSPVCGCVFGLAKRLSCPWWSCDGKLILSNNSPVLRNIHGSGQERKQGPLLRAFVSPSVFCGVSLSHLLPRLVIPALVCTGCLQRQNNNRGLLGKPAETS